MDLLSVSPVIPVVDVRDPALAVPLARALLAGGVPLIELTLRGDGALDALRAVADEVPEMLVGAGTVCSPEQVKLATAAGARFLVSPGSTDRLLDAFEDSGLPFLAGTATPSDVLRLLERGITQAKLFPAVAVGGTTLLRALHGPFPQVRFCPTGGISHRTAQDFLALPNVGCVGGTWLTPGAAVASHDWATVTGLARDSLQLRR
ncbi:MAG: bifunctional 4-hydroxy-2-oxoglutarate aldolase/2-dehydro-3-deoxy-phosphogluconate aldolase [Jatrophihabitans sp.]|uniref:bifunctional 4-hydroxy-2-oxoglutarate aldolase/2-dehydro-3-deoxy-phosphogluconate aldolase n=1 Tax=Jatrophihabitans sp. TaxID=1932789 RepID=UPI003F7DA6FF